MEEGRVYGLLGPNGAGKTTTMNIMTGYLAATEGTVTIDGYDILEDPKEAKSRIGYLPEQPPLYLEMTPYEYLQYSAGIKGVAKADRDDEVKRVMKLTGVTQVSGRVIRNLSKGFRQRVGLAQAMIGSPQVIILDEPTVGLDPQQVIEVRDIIRKLGKDHTVILSSHILTEVAEVCDYIYIISRGNLVAADTPKNLSRSLQGADILEIRVQGKTAAVERALAHVENLGKVTFKEASEPGTVEFSVECAQGVDRRGDLSMALMRENLPVLSMQVVTLSLEDIFLRLTGQAEEAEDAREKADRKAAAQAEKPEKITEFTTVTLHKDRKEDNDDGSIS